MTRDEYMKQLCTALRDMDTATALELMEDVSAHFAEGAANGQREEDICMELGAPEALAAEAGAIIGKEAEAESIIGKEQNTVRPDNNDSEVSAEAGENISGISPDVPDIRTSGTEKEAKSGTGTEKETKFGTGTEAKSGAETAAGNAAKQRDSENRLERCVRSVSRVELYAEYADVKVRSGKPDEVRVICESTDPKVLAQFYCEREDGILRTGLRKRTEYSILERLFNRSEVKISLILPDGLPEGAVLSSSSGDIDAELLRMPRLDFHTASGDIYARFTDSRTLLLQTASGDIRLEGNHAGRIDAASASGDVDFNGIKAETVKAEAASGDFSCRDGRLKTLICSSASGDIDVSGQTASLRSKTASGDIRVCCTGPCAVELKTVSGDAVLISGEEISGHIESVSGDIRLETETIARGLSVNYSTVSGDLRVQRSCEKESGRRGGRVFIPGSGTRENAALLNIRTASGDLIIR